MLRLLASHRQNGLLVATFLLFVFTATSALAASYTFSWTANPEPVEGYKLYYKKDGAAAEPFDGTDAAEGVSPIKVGKVTSYTISGLQDNTTYHFALSAYNGDEESALTDVITVFPGQSVVSAVIGTSSTSGEAPLTVTFDGTGSTTTIPPMTSYVWDFGDGSSTVSGSGATHTYAEAGTYSVSLLVTDSTGNSASATTSITVTVTSEVAAVIGTSSTSGEAPFTVTFDGTGSTTTIPPMTSYVWNFGDGSSTVSGSGVTHTYTEAGTYPVSLLVTDSTGNSASATTSITVTVTSEVAAVIGTSSTSGEAPLTVTFNGTGSTTTIPPMTSYVWNFGDGSSTVSGSEVTHTYTGAGTYPVSLLVTDSTGNSASATTSITVTVTSEVAAVIGTSSTSGEAPLTVTFDGTGSTTTIPPMTSYVWNFGDGSGTVSGSGATHTYTEAGTYPVSLLVTDSTGNSASASMSITVLAAPVEEIDTTTSYTFSWTANPEPVEGYKLYYKKGGAAAEPFDGTDAAEGVSPIKVGKVTSYTISGLQDNTTYHFALSAYNGDEESALTDVITVFPGQSVVSAVIGTTSTSGEAPLTVTFDGTGSTTTMPPMSSYVWNFGDGSSTVSGSGATHTYTQAGTYPVSLLVTDSTGNSASASTSITVTVTSEVAAVIGTSSTSGEAPLTVTFNGTGSTTTIPPMTSYVWNFGDGSSTVSGSGATHTYTQAGTYPVSLLVTDSTGNSASASTSITVTVTSEVAAVIGTSSTSGEAPLTVTFNGTGSTTTIPPMTSYVWNFGDGSSTVSGSEVTHTYTGAGTYPVSLLVTDSTGNSASATTSITVKVTSEVAAVIGTSSTSGEAPLTVTFNGTGSTTTIPPMTSYVWNFGDGSSTVSGSEVTHTYTGAGTYPVSLLVTDSTGNSASATTSITVTVTSEVAAVIGTSSTSGEAPLTVTFNGTGSTTTIPPMTSYVWNFGDGSSTVSGSEVTHTYTGAGTYPVSLLVTDSTGNSASATTSITVTVTSEVTAVIATPSTSGEAPFTVTFNGTGSTTTIPPMSSYVWTFGDGSSPVSGSEVTHTFTEVGAYPVTLLATDGTGNSASATTSITVLAAPAEEPVTTTSYTFSWTANPEPVEGYRLYYKKGGEATAPFDGDDAYEGVSPINVGKVTTFTITGLEENTTYHFALSAYNGSEESALTDVITVFPTSTGTTLVADAVASIAEGEVPLTVDFSGAYSTGDIVTYSWDFGDGGTGTGSLVAHTYDIEGLYTTTLTVTASDGLQDQASISIQALESSATPVEEKSSITVVIFPTNIQGEAPLAAAFDGSGSSTTISSIESYGWDFGDGSSAEGAQVSHNYIEAGTYTVTLSVTDGTSNSASATTTVVVSAAPVVQPNQTPIALFTPSVVEGVAPVTVTFDASGSSDSDGDIVDYNWNFGGGTGTSGQTASYTYNDAGIYEVILTVTDDKGAQASVAETITITAPPELYFEAGEIVIESEWQRFSFAKQFASIPVVIVGPPTYTDTAPGIVRIRNVDTSGFEIRMQEWDYLDDVHGPETVSYFAVEPGSYTLADGRTLEAGTAEATSVVQNFAFKQTFDTTPLLFTQVLTENEADAVLGQIMTVGNASFEYRLREMESTSETHPAETFGYLAWSPGTGTVDGISYELGVASKIGTAMTKITFGQSYADIPFLFTSIQKIKEIDTAAIRYRNLSTSSVEIMLEEEQSLDSEIRHKFETVGYFIISPSTE